MIILAHTIAPFARLVPVFRTPELAAGASRSNEDYAVDIRKGASPRFDVDCRVTHAHSSGAAAEKDGRVASAVAGLRITITIWSPSYISDQKIRRLQAADT